MRGVDELVPGAGVSLARVVLHLLADDPALGVEHGQAGAQLVREGEEVQLHAQLAVVAALGLGQTLLVGLQLVLGGPGRAVDPLQLLVLLVAAPVRRGGAHERVAVADVLGVRQVRAAAEVAPHHVPALAVHVVVDRELATAHLHGRTFGGLLHGTGARPAGQVDELELVGLVGHLRARLVLRDRAAAEDLVPVDDLQHRLLELLEVLGSERLRDVEVEVEAVRDVRADAQLGVRTQLLHRLRHHVRRGVAQHLEPFGITHEHPFHDVPVLQGRGQVLEDTIDVRHHHVPLLGVELGGRGARLRGAGLAVHGELQCWGIRHGVSPRQFCVCPPVPGARIPRTCRARP